MVSPSTFRTHVWRHSVFFTLFPRILTVNLCVIDVPFRDEWVCQANRSLWNAARACSLKVPSAFEGSDESSRTFFVTASLHAPLNHTPPNSYGSVRKVTRVWQKKTSACPDSHIQPVTSEVNDRSFGECSLPTTANVWKLQQFPDFFSTTNIWLFKGPPTLRHRSTVINCTILSTGDALGNPE